MHENLLELLVDPDAWGPLAAEGLVHAEDGSIQSGELVASSGARYTITNGIPRFVVERDSGQAQTAESFGYKWNQRDSFGSAGGTEALTGWLVGRYGFESADAMRSYFAGRRLILDAGCGGGYSSGMWMTEPLKGAQWVGADISSAIDVAQDRLPKGPCTHFVQADLMQLPFADGTFDTVFSEGVLHHTPSTKDALQQMARVLAPGGELMFYVYRKKSPMREYADDFIRDAINDLPPDAAWERLRPLTKLGQALAGLKTSIVVEEDVPILEIPAGTYDIQRLIYWHFAKLFWNDAMSFEENHHINFDWYHPRYAHRQTEEEVRAWCAEMVLQITHFDHQESGFTVRALKG